MNIKSFKVRILSSGKFIRKSFVNINGFTLIELLVVIAIIGTLASLAFVSYGSVEVQARNTQRKSDLKQYQTMMETLANQSDGFYLRRSNPSGVNLKSTICERDMENPSSDCPPDPRDGETECGDQRCRYMYQSNRPSGCGGGEPCATQYVMWAPVEEPKSNEEYWVVCSDGKSGFALASAIPSTGGVCPL